MLYDSLLVLALLFLLTLPFVAKRGGNPVAVDDNLLYQVSIVVVIFGFFVGFWSRSGRTLGMQAWGLRVETLDGQTPTVKMASVRFLAELLSLLPAGLGFIWQLWDVDNLTWHDRLSESRLRHYPKMKANRG